MSVIECDRCIVDPSVDNAIDSCGFTCAWRKKKLPDLNKFATTQNSLKKVTIPRKPSVAKNIHKANVDKEGDFVFQSLRSLLTVLCKFAQEDIASIYVGHVTSDAISNALQNGANGGSVSTTKLDDPSVMTILAYCASVLETVDKHAISTSELDYLRLCNPNNSSNIVLDCIVLDCVDSTVRAESSTIGMKILYIVTSRRRSQGHLSHTTRNQHLNMRR